MKNRNVQKVAGLGLLTAIVIVLQLMGSFIRIGIFSVSLVLVPIVIGAALYGASAGGWLGFVFGVTVLLSGDAGPFLAVNIPGTIVTVLGKGICCGAASGLLFTLVSKKSLFAATVVSAVICPIVNTGIFLACCPIFFYDTIAGWAQAAGAANGITAYLIFGLAGFNFLVELGINALLIPILLRIIFAVRKKIQ